MAFVKLTDVDLAGRRVLIRADLNVPVSAGRVTSDARIVASLATITHCLDAGAKVMVMSHRGRPTEGRYDERHTLAPIATDLSAKLGREVRLIRDYLHGEAFAVRDGEPVLLENVRFNTGEQHDSAALAQRYAALCDVFVMDAFGAAHRAQASTHGVGRFAPIACAGLLLTEELHALAKALANPARPMIAIVGGAKVSTKLTVLDALSEKVDQLVVGGGIANTFLAAAGYPVGRSLHEAGQIHIAKALMDKLAARGATIPLATDVVCGKRLDAQEPAVLKSATAVAADDRILDIGPDSAHAVAALIGKAGTIVWNGPLGVFEFDAFGAGTQTVAAAIAAAQGFSLAGGGDTIAAIQKYGIADGVSYISTAGGAFLEYLEGKTLPAVAMLAARAGA